MTFTNHGLFTPYTPDPNSTEQIILDGIQIGARFVRNANGTDFYVLRRTMLNASLTFMVVNQNGTVRLADNDVERLDTTNGHFVTIERVADPKALERKLFDLQTGTFGDPPPAPILAVSKVQGKLALLEAGLLADAEAAVQAAGPAAQIWYADAPTWFRSDPTLNSIGAALNLTSEQIDNLFQVASTK